MASMFGAEDRMAAQSSHVLLSGEGRDGENDTELEAQAFPFGESARVPIFHLGRQRFGPALAFAAMLAGAALAACVVAAAWRPREITAAADANGEFEQLQQAGYGAYAQQPAALLAQQPAAPLQVAPVPPVPVAPAAVAFDCDAGFANWAMGWSEQKKVWCCQQAGKGCAGGAAAVVDPAVVDPQPLQANYVPPNQGPATGPWVEAEARAKEILATLTLEDKVALLRGQNDAWPNDRHGFAGFVQMNGSLAPWDAKNPMPLSMNDGPQGYNVYGTHPGTTTQFPCLLALAATFDPGAATAYATAIAEEFVGKGANVLLGPDVEVMRAPLTGRSFETLSGEEPYLGAQLVGPFVTAVQAHGIIATVKHWLDNNEEIYRQTMDVEIDDRTQHEIYMAVFKAAIDAGAASVMCSYNKVYGTHACENEKLLKTLLREELNFRGYVISDWGATHDAVRSAMAGLDIDMQTTDPKKRLPDEYHKLPELLTQGIVSQAMIDEKALHVLAAQVVVGQMDGKFATPQEILAADGAHQGVINQRLAQEEVLKHDVTSDAHRAVAKQTIIDSAVLLKNEGATLPLAATAGKKIVMVGKYCNTDKDESYGQGSVFSGGGSGYVQTDKTVTPLDGLKARITDTQVTWSPDAAGAAGADVAIVCLAAHSEEGWDRKDLEVPEAAALVGGLRAASATTKIVVLAIVPGAVTTDWAADADAVMMLFMPGEQVGPAVAALLTGDAGPGGRLPVSMPAAGETRFTPDQYPGNPFNDVNMVAKFSEGRLIGYRWNDANGVPAAYAFGFGLSYTEFELSHLDASCGQLSFTVTNKGARAGWAVPQVYIGFQSMQPVLRQLKGFAKVHIEAGASQVVTISLTAEAWSYYNSAAGGWAVASGEELTISIGQSSADLPLQTTLVC